MINEETKTISHARKFTTSNANPQTTTQNTQADE
jgi:hypothetical protein